MTKNLELQTGETIQARFAQTFFQRACGLLFSSRLLRNECLVITSCRSVHTIGMRYALDIVFIDCLGVVTDVHLNVSPFRVVFGHNSALSAVEFVAGALAQGQIQVGKRLFN